MAVYMGMNNCCDAHQVPITKKAAARAELVEKQTNKRTNNNTSELLGVVTSNEYINPLSCG
jgi:hypothetical protein